MAKQTPTLDLFSTKKIVDEILRRSRENKLSTDDLRKLYLVIEEESRKGVLSLPTPKDKDSAHLVSMGFTVPYFCKVLSQKILRKPSPEIRRVWLRYLRLKYPEEWEELAADFGRGGGEEPTT